jgi:hypothetical protein
MDRISKRQRWVRHGTEAGKTNKKSKVKKNLMERYHSTLRYMPAVSM